MMPATPTCQTSRPDQPAPVRAIHAVCLYLFILPFSETAFLDANLLGISGVKPFVLICTAILAYLFLVRKSLNKIPPGAIALIAIVVLLAGISVVRSIDLVELFHRQFGTPLSQPRYVFGHLLKPLFYFLPIVLIIKAVRSRGDFEMVTRTILYSATLVSLVVLYLYFARSYNLGFRVMRQNVHGVFSLHGNAIAIFLVQVLPLVYVRFCEKGTSRTTFLMALVILGAVGALSCRTAYFLVFFTPLVFFCLTRRRSVSFILLAAVALYVTAPNDVAERVTTGFVPKKEAQKGRLPSLNEPEFSVDDFTSGRWNSLWRPILQEYGTSWRVLLVGGGRYSMLRIPVFHSDADQERHPHNAYLEMVIDCGLIAFLVLACAFSRVYKEILRSARQLQSQRLKDHQLAIIASIGCYLLSAVISRTFFPHFVSTYFWVFLGLGVACAHMVGSGASSTEETSHVRAKAT